MSERPTKAASNRPRTLPSVHFQNRLIVPYSCEFPIGPENRARTIASRGIPLHSAYILGRADDVTATAEYPRRTGASWRQHLTGDSRAGKMPALPNASPAFLGNQLLALLLVARQGALDYRD